MADPRKPTVTELWPLLHAQRSAVADVLGLLGDDEWSTASLCSAWRVRDVTAHCIETHLMTPGRFVGKMAAVGFRFHAMSAKGVQAHAAETPAQLLTEFRATATRSTTPPGPKVAMLAEAVIHGADMAVPAGKTMVVAPDALVATAEFCANASPLLHSKQRREGLRLRATDVDWTIGDGPEVSGPALSIILAITGRRAGLDQLSGDGLTTLRTRV